jgi:hypothetical protein
VVDGDGVSAPPWLVVGAVVKLPPEPPLSVRVSVAEGVEEEVDLVFSGVDETVVLLTVASAPEEVVVADPAPPPAGPDITPVYVALKAE